MNDTSKAMLPSVELASDIRVPRAIDDSGSARCPRLKLVACNLSVSETW